MLIRLLTAVITLTAFSAKAQTADEVINNYVEAIGGKELINSIKTMVTENTLSVMGNELPNVTTVVVGKGFRNVSSFGGQDIVQVITPTGGWMINPLQGINEPQDLPEEQVKAAQSSLQVGGELNNWQEKGSKVELQGTEKVDGQEVYKVRLTTKDNRVTTYYFRKDNHYLVRREFELNINGQDLQGVAIYSDYKKTDFGMVVPFSMVLNQGVELNFTVNKVTFNSEIDPKLFEKK